MRRRISMENENENTDIKKDADAERGDTKEKDVNTSDKKEESSEEINKRIKEAVEIEKKKLYDTLGATKQEAKEALEKINQYEKEKADLAKQKEEAELKKKEELESQEKEKLDLSERLKQLEDSLKVKDEQLKHTIDSQKKLFQEELSKRDLAVKREKLLGQHKGEIVPDLVIGNTEEELEKSLEKAKSRYKEIYEEAKKNVESASLNNGKLPTSSGQNKVPNTEGAPAGTGDSSEAAKSIDELAAMSVDEFKKYKDKVLAEKGL